jgi:hypothetical protein
MPYPLQGPIKSAWVHLLSLVDVARSGMGPRETPARLSKGKERCPAGS